jgi:bifunctional UDP-N-acetylglucosamine pyrophosphorylase/glucosamine-1-phosphate N-acetyltransferase
VLLAAGRGTRLAPLTDDCPKPLITTGGLPILDWSLSALPSSIEEVIIVVGYLKEMIEARYGTEWEGRSIRYVEQKELKGTGHAVHILSPLVDDRFLVLNGDDLYLPSDLEALCTHDRAVLALEAKEGGRFGALESDANGNLTAIVEGGIGSMINIGAYLMDRTYFDEPLVAIKGGAEYGLPQTLVNVARTHPIRVVAAHAWFPIGFPEDIERADAWIAAHRA